MNKFKPGDVVEFMTDDHPRAEHLYPEPPGVGRHYTVRGIGNFAGIPGIYLEGLHGLPRQPWGDEEQSIREDRFKMVEESAK